LSASIVLGMEKSHGTTLNIHPFEPGVLLEVGWQPSEQNVVGIILTYMIHNERPSTENQQQNVNDRDIKQ